MIVSFSLGLLCAFILGYALIWLIWPQSARPALLIAVLALPAGWALTSVTYFFWLILSDGQSSWYVMLEILLLLLVVGLFLKSSRGIKTLNCFVRPKSRAAILLPLSVLAVTGFVFTIPVKLAIVNPWGYWDAWSRINVKARFLFAGDSQWTWFFESGHVSQSDYPLLLPALVARSWRWMGDISLFAPQAISLIWGLWSVLVLYSLVAWLRDHVVATIVAFAYLTFTPLLFWSSAQYSDIPLACYMMIGCSLMIAVEKFPEEATPFAFLAGFFAGSAAWCKNEGLVFLFLIFCWWLILLYRKKLPAQENATGWFLFGVGSIGSAVLVLKGFYAGRPDLAAGHSSLQSVYSLLVDSERHRAIGQELVQSLDTLWQGWPVLLLAGAFLVWHFMAHYRIARLGPLACVGAMGAVYYLIFATTPHDLSWHLQTAIDRLILQLWPVFLLGCALMFEDENDRQRAPERVS